MRNARNTLAEIGNAQERQRVLFKQLKKKDDPELKEEEIESLMEIKKAERELYAKLIQFFEDTIEEMEEVEEGKQ